MTDQEWIDYTDKMAAWFEEEEAKGIPANKAPARYACLGPIDCTDA